MKHRAKGQGLSKQQRGVVADTKIVGVGIFVTKIAVFRVATSLLVTATFIRST